MYENVPTVSTLERQQVMQALERLQAKLLQRDERTHSERLGALRDALRSPLLGHILTLQHSIKQLRDQLNCMPPDTCSDFSFSRKGQLIFSASRPASSLLGTGPGSVVSNGTSFSSVSIFSSEQLQRWIQATAKGRQTERISLPKPLSGGLGFSVVGLKPEGVGGHGVFIRQVQPGSIADRDGRMKENDQILAINGTPLDQSVTQQQAISLLQQAGDRVELVVARDAAAPQHSHPPGPVRMEQWGHVEEIELVNDGSGLGFGIVGGKATGVVVRTLVPGSVADRDGRLRTGDHILRIGDTPTQGLASDQVVRVLQGCGSHVRMLVARDPQGEPRPAPPPPPAPAAAPVSALPPLPPIPPRRGSKTPNLEGYEIHEVALKKKEGQSLGISIVGYNALTSENAVGVFVKYVVPGSAAEQSGNIRVHDRIIALDGVSLQGFTNQEVLEVMKQTGQTVQLTLVRKMAAKRTAVERSLDKVEREPSRVSLKRSAEIKVRLDAQKGPVMEAADGGLGGIKPQLAGAPDQVSLTERELRAKWEQALGPDYSVLVVELDPVIEDDAELQKYSKLLPIHTMRLGVELDSFDGHHYISTVAPEGPVAKHGLLRPEDELLEVNGVQLYGKPRREAVAFLREVPPPFTLVCCRHLTEEGSDFPPDEEEQQSEGHSVSPVASLKEQIHNNPPVLAERSSPWPSETELSLEEAVPDPAGKQEVEELHEVEGDVEEEEEEGELALWSPEVKVLELEKGEQGLGFSILDYQDPLDVARSVIVIRSLVPGGVAEKHGGILPGDQLVFVNNMHLDTCHLAQAVEVLKAAPPGKVYLGIRKPLVTEGMEERGQEEPNLESTVGQPEELVDRVSLTDRQSSPPVPPGFADEPLFPEQLVDEPELILDGSFSLPRYTPPLTAGEVLGLHLLSREEREMAVDEEPEEEIDRDDKTEEEEGELPMYPERTSSSVEEPMEHAASVDLPPTQASLPQEEKVEEEEEEEADVVDDVQRPALDLQGGLPLSHPAGMWRESVESDVDSDSRNGGSELTLTDTDTESVQLAAKEKAKRRSQGTSRPGLRGGYRDLPEREEGEGEETPVFSHWGPPRRVEVWQEPQESLGISIVGGRTVIKRLKNGEELKGIFIKQVLPDSPAGRTQALKTGDKILQVSGIDLQNASHEEAVQAIKGAASPVVFIVQSLSATPRPLSVMASSMSKHKAKKKSAQRAVMGSAPPPMRLPPPYRPPGGQAEKVEQEKEEEEEELDRARGYNG